MASKADIEDFVNIFVHADQSAGADAPHGPHHGAPEQRFYQGWVQQGVCRVLTSLHSLSMIGSAQHFNPKLQGYISPAVGNAAEC